MGGARLRNILNGGALVFITLLFFLDFLVPSPFPYRPPFRLASFAVSFFQNAALFLAAVGLSLASIRACPERLRWLWKRIVLTVALLFCLTDHVVSRMYQKNFVDIMVAFLRAGLPFARTLDALRRSGAMGYLEIPPLVILAIGVASLFLRKQRLVPREPAGDGAWQGGSVPPFLLAVAFCGVFFFARALPCDRYDALRGMAASTAGSLRRDRGPVLLFRLSQESSPAEAGRRLASAPLPERNVLVVILESVGAKYLLPAWMPTLDGLRREGLATTSTSSSNVSSLSLYSVFSGRPALMRKFTLDGPGRARNRRLLDRLKRLGYKLALLGDSPMRHLVDPLADRPDQIFDEYWDEESLAAANRPHSFIFTRARQLLEGRDRWVVFLFPQTTHFPYNGDPACVARHRGDSAAHPLAELKTRYQCALQRLDGEIAGLLGGGDGTAPLTRTDIFALGDHGEEFREEGYLFHSSGLTESQLATPLLVRSGSAALAGLDWSQFSHQLVLPAILCTAGDCSPRDRELLDRCLGKSVAVVSSGPGAISWDCRVRAGAHTLPCHYSVSRDGDEVRVSLSDVLAPEEARHLGECVSYYPASVTQAAITRLGD